MSNRSREWFVPVALGPGCRTAGYVFQVAETAEEAEHFVRTRRSSGEALQLVWGSVPEDPLELKTYEARKWPEGKENVGD